MYLPRPLLAHLYSHLLHTHHILSSPILILVSLDTDSLCACRILTTLLKRDYIQHNIHPISGYADLAHAGEALVAPMRVSGGGVVICLGVGGMIDLENGFGFEADDGLGFGGVEVWVLDSRRPWNLGNVFGGLRISEEEQEQHAQDVMKRVYGVESGKIMRNYSPGKGGIICFDDGDIEDELEKEKEAYSALSEMPDVDDGDGSDSDDEDVDDEEELATQETERIPESGQEQAGLKRKSWSDRDTDSESDDERPARRRRSNSSTPIPSSPARPTRRGLLIGGSSDESRSGSPADHSSRASSAEIQAVPKQPSARTLRRRLRRLRQKHESVLRSYYNLGTSYSEPISSLMYSLASELGREDNDLLWLAIVGVSSADLNGRTSSGLGLSTRLINGRRRDRGGHVRQVLRDEVRRLNAPREEDLLRERSGVIMTTATTATDTRIVLSPEPRFLLIRHWSLYDSMLHSSFLAPKLHMWSDAGRRRLHKLLAKMGVSLTQCKQSYTHMDMNLKRDLRKAVLKFAPMYGLDGLVPNDDSKDEWGFVRCWGWKACVSAVDVGVVIGAILEVGDLSKHAAAAASASDVASKAVQASQVSLAEQTSGADAAIQDDLQTRFWLAYDSLASPTLIAQHIPTAQYLHRAILRTGTGLISKRQIRHLRSFRMAVVKEGPDVPLFTHPGALIQLALWLGEAIREMEGIKKGGRGGELVVAGEDVARGVYVVVGVGGGVSTSTDPDKQKKVEEKRAAREARKEAKNNEKERRRQLKQERLAANGMSDDEDEEEDESEEDTEEDEDSEDEDEVQPRGHGRNRFGNAFHEVIEETGARVKVDSFENCVVEVKKEDLGAFLESLSLKAVTS